MLTTLEQVEPAIACFEANTKRSGDMYSFTKVPPHEMHLPLRPERLDILRACVVFLHASIEDLTRSIGRVAMLLDASEELMDEVSLVGHSSRGEGKPLKLSALRKHRGKTVDEVILESVAAYLDRKTFNHVPDMQGFLREIGLDTARLSPYWKSIQQLMMWRHRIAHRADVHVGESSPRELLVEDAIIFLRASAFMYPMAIEFRLMFVTDVEMREKLITVADKKLSMCRTAINDMVPGAGDD